MIDIQQETLLSIPEATRAVPAVDGRQPHPSTVFRWMFSGIRGVKLEHARIGRRIVTSEEALQRFVNKCSSDGAAPGRTEGERNRGVEGATSQLAAHGVVV